MAKQKLRTIIILPFMIQILGIVGLVGYLSFKNGQQAVDNLAAQLTAELESHIVDQLDSYLSEPRKLNTFNKAALDLKQIDFDNLESLKQHFNLQSKIFNKISHIQFGRLDGEFVGLTLNEDGSREFQMTEGSGTLDTFEINLDDSQGTLLKSVRHFDPRSQPWYNDPRDADQSIWTQIYTRAASQDLAITLGEPYYDPEGKFQGILATTLSLKQISNFLGSLAIGQNGQSFILDKWGYIIATSSNSEAAFRTSDLGPMPMFAIESSNPITQQSINYLKAEVGNLNSIQISQQYRIKLEGTRYYLNVVPYKDNYGLDWLTVVVIPETDFMAKIAKNTRMTLILCSLAMILAIASGLITTRWITEPISRLNQAAKSIATGNYNQVIQLNRQDELGELGHAFNTMAHQLQSSFQALQDSNAALAESQAELAENNHNLELKVQQRTEKLVKTEKLAALGQLTAGIAHEINTPLGAIQASNDSIAVALGESIAQLPRLPQMLQQLSKEELKEFLILIGLSQHSQEMMSSREIRALRKSWQRQLQLQGIDHAREKADTLSSMGIPTQSQSFLSLFRTHNSQDILNLAHGLSIIQNSTSNIQLAVQRASKIVFALKSYTRQGHQEQLVMAAIPETIETVLTLYQNQLKHKIEVERHYEDLPKINCYPEPLAQVWTNLIYNALQAMQYEGSLKITARERDRHIVVSITDSGSGIPSEIQGKIFEPFFTTKRIGEGSGLGLDIVNKIIQKHQGRIELESQPGQTTFQIWLPMDRVAEPTGSEVLDSKARQITPQDNRPHSSLINGSSSPVCPTI